MSIPAYPLQWPTGWKRSAASARTRARFGEQGQSSYGQWQTRKQLSIAKAVERVRDELARMGVTDDDVVVSTDLRLRLDGLPRSSQPEPTDPGAAVYWQHHGPSDQPPRCMAIDRYDRVADNLAAIAATLQAMRAIERHGGAEILNRAFTGFTALEHVPDHAPWWQVLGLDPSANESVVRATYRILRAKHHPDKGGDAEAFQAVQQAYEEAMRMQGAA